MFGFCLPKAEQKYLSNISPFLGCCLHNLSPPAFLGQAEISPCADCFFHQSCGLIMYMQFVIDLLILFWFLFLQLVVCRPAPSPGCGFGEPANVCWGTSQPPLRSFYLHTPFLANHFQVSWSEALQPTCGTILLPVLCEGTDLWMLLPLGSPAITPWQHPAEQK